MNVFSVHVPSEIRIEIPFLLYTIQVFILNRTITNARFRIILFIIFRRE